MNLLPWIMAAMWFVARLLARQFMSIENAHSFGVLSNMLLIVILIFLAIHYKYKTASAEQPTFFDDLRECMKAAMKYVLGIVAAMLLYYGLLTDDIAEKRNANLEAFASAIATDEGLEKWRQQWPDFANMSREQILESKREDVNTFISVHVQTLGGLLALTLVCIIYSLLAVFFWRSIVKRV